MARTVAKGDRIKVRKVKRCSDLGGQMIDKEVKMKEIGGKMMGKMKEAKGVFSGKHDYDDEKRQDGELADVVRRQLEDGSGGKMKVSWVGKMIGGKMKMSRVGPWMLGRRGMRKAENWDLMVNV